MPPRVRKGILVLHVGSSVGWLGAVIAFLILAIIAATTNNESLLRALYVSMDVLGRTALVPLGIASLVTGIIQSLGTQWGLIRHYWVIVKLVITFVSTVILVLYIQTLTTLAAAAVNPRAGIGPGEILPNFSPVLHAAGALLVLTLALGLSIYKPRGLTGFGLPVRARSAFTSSR